MPTRPPGTPDVDLTLDDSFGIINYAVFGTSQLQTAGTGSLRPFVQIQHTGTEQGYNTDAAPQFDERNTAQDNHSLLLANIPIVFGDGADGTTEGLAYREFRLDLNEKTSKQF